VFLQIRAKGLNHAQVASPDLARKHERNEAKTNSGTLKIHAVITDDIKAIKVIRAANHTDSVKCRT